MVTKEFFKTFKIVRKPIEFIRDRRKRFNCINLEYKMPIVYSPNHKDLDFVRMNENERKCVSYSILLHLFHFFMLFLYLSSKFSDHMVHLSNSRGKNYFIRNKVIKFNVALIYTIVTYGISIELLSKPFCILYSYIYLMAMHFMNFVYDAILFLRNTG